VRCDGVQRPLVRFFSPYFHDRMHAVDRPRSAAYIVCRWNPIGNRSTCSHDRCTDSQTELSARMQWSNSGWASACGWLRFRT